MNNPIMQTTKREGLSEKYTFISTKELKDKLESGGFILDRERISGSRKNPGFQKHLLAFRNPEMLKPFERIKTLLGERAGGMVPELLVLNSHDGTSGLRFNIGIFYGATGNGTVTTHTLATKKSIRHSANGLKSIDEHLSNFNHIVEIVADDLEKFSKRALSNSEKLDFANKILQERFKGDENFVSVDAWQLVNDLSQDDLLTTLNTIQDKILKGDFTYLAKKKDVVMSRKGRRITAMTKQIEISKFLWGYAKNMV